MKILFRFILILMIEIKINNSSTNEIIKESFTNLKKTGRNQNFESQNASPQSQSSTYYASLSNVLVLQCGCSAPADVNVVFKNVLDKVCVNILN